MIPGIYYMRDVFKDSFVTELIYKPDKQTKKVVDDLVVKSIFENSEESCGLSLHDLTVEQKEQIKDYAAHLVAERGVDGWEALGLALEDVASIDQCEPQQVFSQDDALHVEMMAKQLQNPNNTVD